MRYMRMFIPGFGLLIMLAVVGCGDNDNCVSCPEPAASPIGFTQGILFLSEGSTFMNLEILGNGSGLPNPDSVKVGDSLISRTEWQYGYNWPFVDLHYAIQFQEDGFPRTFMYHHGDTATIKVWAQERSCACRLKILDVDSSTATITSPISDADTIDPVASDTIYWNDVEAADYYAIVVAYLLEWEGFPRIGYYFTTDTTFILTGAMYDSLAAMLEIYVNAFNGPDPQTGQSNWSGDLLDGVVFSAGLYDMTKIHVFQLLKSSEAVPTESVKILPEPSPEEIVGNLYKQFRN